MWTVTSQFVHFWANAQTANWYLAQSARGRESERSWWGCWIISWAQPAQVCCMAEQVSSTHHEEREDKRPTLCRPPTPVRHKLNTSVYLHCEETGQYGIMLKYFACAWPDIPFQTLQSLWTDSQWKVKKTAEIMKGQKVALKMEMIRN